MSGIAPAVLRFRLVMPRFAIRRISPLKLALNHGGAIEQHRYRQPSGVPNQVKMTVADLCTEAVRSFVAGSRVVHRDPGGTFNPGPQHLIGFAKE
jgi:hypothetical protein